MLLKQSRLDVVPETKSIRTVVLHDFVSESWRLSGLSLWSGRSTFYRCRQRVFWFDSRCAGHCYPCWVSVWWLSLLFWLWMRRCDFKLVHHCAVSISWPCFRSPDEAMITVNWSHRCFDHARPWCGLFYYLPIDLWLRLVVGRGSRYTFFPSMNSLSGVNAFFRTAPLTYFSFLQCFLVQRRDTLVLRRPDW